MGCYWKCQCTFATGSRSIGEKIKQYLLDSGNDTFVWNKRLCVNVDISDDDVCIDYNDHSSYGFGDSFECMIAEIAEEFSLDGEMYISTDEDEGNPPQKTTFEHGKTVYWDAEIVYTRRDDE